jgi:putative nucleotidyltransferase with HDIG domain
MRSATHEHRAKQRRSVTDAGIRACRRNDRTISDALVGDLRFGLAAELHLSTSHAPDAFADAPAHHRSARADTIIGLLAALQAKDPYTAEHSARVEALAVALALRLGLPDAPTRDVRVGALLHDIGKIGIGDDILKKPSRLTDDEYDAMKTHPAVGVSILRPIAFLDSILPMVMHHHEWYDGSGYPDGLCGNEIPFGARVIHVADCIDAMAWPRTYRAGMPIPKIVAELKRGTGGQFDPGIAAVAIDMLSEEPIAGRHILPTIAPTTDCARESRPYPVAAPAL